MNLLWDKLLVENQVILTVKYTSIPQNVFYLFPTMEKVQKFIEKSKSDSSIVQDSIKFKPINEIFNSS